MPELTFTAPIRLISEANQREHWAAKHRRKRAQQNAMTLFWRTSHIVPHIPCSVTITRIGQRRLDTDNLAGACKHVQDAIAAEIGIDDGDPRINWAYAQEIARTFAVRVCVSWTADAAPVPRREHPWRGENRVIRHK